MGKSNLAEYVMHRKAILDILAQNIKYKDQERQKYTYEKNIHQLKSWRIIIIWHLT